MTDATERESPEPLSRRLREAWMKTVGNYATDEKGTQGLLQRLVEFGALSAEEAKKVLTDARHKIDHNRSELDARVDESIKRALERFGEFREAKRLEERIAELEARLRELEQPSV
jgi:polyhydroxyalkanoate synthesis regulator phasin